MIDDFGPDFDLEGNALEEGESDRVKSEEERSQPGRTDDGRRGRRRDDAEEAEDEEPRR